MKYLIGIGLLVVLVIVGLQVVPSSDNRAADGQLHIVTSFYPLQFAAERIVGDMGTVTNIGTGRDPHDVQLSVDNTRSMMDADLVVLQGAGLEPWGEDMEAQLLANDVPVYVATEHLTLRVGDHEEEHADEHEDEHEDEKENGHEDEEGHDAHDHGANDPHTWLDPTLFSETVEHLSEAIAEIDPENATTYEANAAALQAELATLDAEFESRLASCEADALIVSHDSFSYLGERYDITTHAIGGLSTQDMPSATTLAELKEEAAEGAGAILLEKNSVAAYGEALALETGLPTMSINPAAFDIPEGGDYQSVMRTNLDTLVAALRCDEQ
jgi:zinc transport system substrate-binding protein